MTTTTDFHRANAANSLATPITSNHKGASFMKTLFTIAAVLVLFSSAAFAQFETDHFKCYLPLATSALPAQNVILIDEFGTATGKVKDIWRFCNPTLKEHNGVITPITNPDAHLAIHKAVEKTVVARQVQLENQFGVQTVTTGAARFLAVPTQKEPHGPPSNLDHFNCYTVTDGQPVSAQVGLSDQWFASKHKVATPALFCNPVVKNHNGTITPVLHPNDHLACYKMTPVAFDKAVQLHNQFGDPKFESKKADMLCVPSLLLQWKVIQ